LIHFYKRLHILLTMMASVDAEAELDDLFAEEAQEAGTQSLTQEEEEQRAGNQSKVDLTGDGKKKRIIKNPQPKLNPERLMGDKGIQTVEGYFKDWQSKGKGREFDDLELVMKKLEHWAHRLYPKLPFDSVIDIVANRLGKKKAVQTHVKKIRLGMSTAPVRVGGGEEVASDEEKEVERYGGTQEADQPDVFEELVKQSGSSSANLPPVSVNQMRAPGGLTEEQREKMRRNKEVAAKKRREKLEREQKEAEAEHELSNEQREIADQDEIERELMSTDSVDKDYGDNLNLEEMLEEMDQN